MRREAPDRLSGATRNTYHLDTFELVGEDL